MSLFRTERPVETKVLTRGVKKEPELYHNSRNIRNMWTFIKENRKETKNSPNYNI